jgi:hypothetical protein
MTAALCLQNMDLLKTFSTNYPVTVKIWGRYKEIDAINMLTEQDYDRCCSEQFHVPWKLHNCSAGKITHFVAGQIHSVDSSDCKTRKKAKVVVAGSNPT